LPCYISANKYFKNANFDTAKKLFKMIVERTENEVIIRLPATVETEDLQEFLNYARYQELTSGSKVSQTEVDKFADEVNKKWWAANKSKFKKLK